MAFDRSEYDELHAVPKEDPKQQLQLLQQHAVAAQNLTGDQHWDLFLSYLEAARESNRKMRDGVMAELANPRIVNTDKVAELRIAIIRLNERLDLLGHIIAMPEEIKRIGKIAAERLDALAGAQE